MLANNCRNRPEQNRQTKNTEAARKHDNIEGLALQQTYFLEDKEWVVKLELPIPCCIFLKSDFVLAVNFAIQKRADFFILFFFFSGLFLSIDADSAVVMGRLLARPVAW